jgi:two-component system phosphate regulon sensor histidine kinase PhoR
MRLRTKLLIVYIGLAVLILLAAGLLTSSSLSSYFRTWIADDIAIREELMLASLAVDAPGSADALEERIRTLARISGTRVTLVSPTGEVLHDSEIPRERLTLENHLLRPEVQEASRTGRGTDIRHSASVGVDYLYVALRLDSTAAPAPLRNSRYIRLSMPLHELSSVTNEIRFKIIFASLIVLLLASIISVVVSRQIVRPITTIADNVATIREGNLDTRIHVRSRDEVGLVANAINEMVERINSYITQSRKLEQVRNQFLGNVSHELRTPLFALQGFLETLLDGAINDPAVNRDFLAKAHAHAMRLDTLLKDLIDISRIESGEMRMSLRYFALGDLLASVVDDMQPLAKSRNITLSVGAGADLPCQVLGDMSRLTQALTNLIDNAIKYNTPGGSVTVGARDAGDRIWIDVADTGVGIEAEHLPRIFERFYRVDKERSREAGGTGLGLAIVKHIIEAHGGKVEVASTLGRGSTFSFSLRKVE